VSPRPAIARLRLELACVGLAALWLAMLLVEGGPLDQRLYRLLYAGSRPALLVAARVFTALGEPTVLIVAGLLVALLLWRAGRGRLGLALFLIAMTGRGLSELQKLWIAKPRPALDPHLVVVKTSSFPSGHSVSSMIFYTTIALALTMGSRWHRWAVVGAFFLSLCVGISRVMLGVHWPSDVIGGWAFGLLWVLLTFRLAQRFVEQGSSALRR
jgi:membrane-associated phospholipid phosphatase